MRFLDLFSGIGGFRLGMEAAGHKCMGFCEIDKFARKSYKAIHNTRREVELHDVTSVSDDVIRGIGPIDVICGGFPCQAFSIAGKRNGFEDTRGTLFFEITRFASILRPKYLFLENVTGLLSHDNGNTFETILGTLDELGYDAEWQVFNSKHFGVPQNRERVFIIGHLRGRGGRTIFPIGEIGNSIDSVPAQTINTVTTRYSDAEWQGTYIVENKQASIVQKGHGFNKGGEHDIAPTLTSNSYQENNYVKVYDLYNKTTNTIVGTLTVNGHIGNTKKGTFAVQHGYRIRKLTPKECWRLQGFPDWAFERAAKVNSNSQLYKQAGNSVTVNVIYEIAKRLK